MEAINIKNISVQPNVGPAVSLRIINSYINDELNGAKAGDVLNVKAIQKLLSEISGTPGPKGDKGAKGDKGDTGATPTLVNNVTSTSTTSALAAAQGKVLNDLITALTARVSALETA